MGTLDYLWHTMGIPLNIYVKTMTVKLALCYCTVCIMLQFAILVFLLDSQLLTLYSQKIQGIKRN